MYIRKRLDIGWRELAYGVWSSLSRRHSLSKQIEQHWSNKNDILVALSVRSGFDLMLSALALPVGSEVLVSAITIPGMLEILAGHGLNAIPIDLNSDTLSPRLDLMEKAITAKTRAILIAHLFGSRIDLRPIIKLAREHNLLIWEDCAQAFNGLGFCGNPSADISLFSFGPIKTATALGGAIIRVKESHLLLRMRAQQQHYPQQSRLRYLYRLLKYSLIKLASYPLLYRLLIELAGHLGQNYDQLINNLAREFAGKELFSSIRQQPCEALIALLNYQLANYDLQRVEQRAIAGDQVASLIDMMIERPGTATHFHTYWLFPIICRQPEQLIRVLRHAGFDATQGTSNLIVVPTPVDRPALAATAAQTIIENLVYLPVYAELPTSAREHLVEILKQWQAQQQSPIRQTKYQQEMSGSIC